MLDAGDVPMGRVAGTSRGCHRLPGPAFAALAAIAATTWATWSVAVGALVGRWLDGNPLLGSVLGIGLALVLGLAVDRVARRLTGWGRVSVLPASGSGSGGRLAGPTRTGTPRGPGIAAHRRGPLQSPPESAKRR